MSSTHTTPHALATAMAVKIGELSKSDRREATAEIIAQLINQMVALDGHVYASGAVYSIAEQVKNLVERDIETLAKTEMEKRH